MIKSEICLNEWRSAKDPLLVSAKCKCQLVLIISCIYLKCVEGYLTTPGSVLRVPPRTQCVFDPFLQANLCVIKDDSMAWAHA